VSERDRFEFLRARDGLTAALAFERQNVIATYRLVVLRRHGRWRKPGQMPTHTLYRRQMIRAYCEAKRIIREEQGKDLT